MMLCRIAVSYTTQLSGSLYREVDHDLQSQPAVLFVDDLDKCVRFYRDTLGFEPTFSDSVSAAFRLEDQDFVVLKLSAAADMVGEETLALHQGAGRRTLLCADAGDIDALYESLTAKGLTFLKPPVDKPWGRRTAYFADPEGNLWELYQMLPAEE